MVNSRSLASKCLLKKGMRHFPLHLVAYQRKESGKSSSYLGQVVDVGVRHGVEGVDGTSEAVDLLVRVSYEDYPARL